MDTNSLSRHYTSKASFLSSSLSTITAAIDGEEGEWAVIGMEAAEGMRCKDGMRYDQRYSWSKRWVEGKIVEVMAYLDGGLLDLALETNRATFEKV